MKNFKGFRPSFAQAGEYCNLCYLAYETDEKESRKQFQGLANSYLVEIINLCEDNEIKEIARGSVKICRSCDYKDPNIFKHLESNGLDFG